MRSLSFVCVANIHTITQTHGPHTLRATEGDPAEEVKRSNVRPLSDSGRSPDQVAGPARPVL